MIKAFVGAVLYIALICLNTSGSAQTRFLDPVFFGSTKQTNILYGQNVNLLFQPTTLHLDIYKPQGDTTSNRPLFIFCHGGGFTIGSKDEPFIVALCDSFARRGYVTASINYTLVPPNIPGNIGEDTIQFLGAYKAIQDGHAAVRYFYANHQVHGIDTNRIVIGGFSAGAGLSLGLTYMEQEEIPPVLDTAIFGTLTGGNNGFLGFSSKVVGCWNGWGAIGDTNFINPGDIPLVSTHGTQDQNVNCTSLPGIGGLNAYGACAIHNRTNNIGLQNDFLLFNGGGHGVPIQSVYMDSVTDFLADFFYKIVEPCGPPLNLSTTNVGPNGAILNWEILHFNSNPSIRIEGRKLGSSNRIQLNFFNYNQSQLEVSNLQKNTTYEWRVAYLCDTQNNLLSEYASINSFTTGCNPPEGTRIEHSISGQPYLVWEKVVGVSWYKLRIEDVTNNQQFVEIVHPDSNSYGLSHFASGITYLLNIRSVCGSPGNEQSTFTAQISFTAPSFSRFEQRIVQLNTKTSNSFKLYNIQGKLVDSGSIRKLSQHVHIGIYILHQYMEDGSVEISKIAHFPDSEFE